MKTDATGKLISSYLNQRSNDPQENVKNTRKTLKVLQQAATDKENLVGRAQRSGKEIILPKSSFSDSDLESKKKIKTCSKYVQTSSGIKVDINDLTSEAGPSENYWEVIAEKRRLALDESLQENQTLHEENDALREENKIIKDMLNESRNLVEILTEMLNEAENPAEDAETPAENQSEEIEPSNDE